jgi:hypothetical protein
VRALLAPLLTGWLVATFAALTMHGWWWPGRHVVAALPFAGLALACWVDGHRRRLAAVMALAGAGLASRLWLLAEVRSGRRTLIGDFEQTAAPPVRLLRPLLPDFRAPSGATTTLALAWVAALVISAAWAYRGASPGRRPATGGSAGQADEDAGGSEGAHPDALTVDVDGDRAIRR